MASWSKLGLLQPVNPKLVTDIFSNSVTVCTNQNEHHLYCLASIFGFHFFTNWSSGKKIDCSELLLYHLEHDPGFDIAETVSKEKCNEFSELMKQMGVHLDIVLLIQKVMI